MSGDRVLIVDDSGVNRKLLSAILRKEGYILDEASSGEDALTAIAESPPDLVLLDVMMPGLDGFEVIRRLIDRPETANLSVIFLTALSEARHKVRGLELGAVDYITKPFDRSEVLARVRTQLRINHLARSLLQKQRRIDEDLSAAADIQRSLIMLGQPSAPGVVTATRFEPCDSIGGDIFNSVRLDDRYLVLYIVDVSGHGVPSAMVTVSVAQSLSPQAGLIVRPDGEGAGSLPVAPAEVLEQLDGEYPMERFDKYFTIAYLLLDLQTGRMRYSSAAHPPPLLARADGVLVRLEEGGSIIGSGLGIPYEEGEVELSEGDRLYLYTDGLTEQIGRTGEQFGDERFAELLGESAPTTLDATCDRVMSSLADHAHGGALQDDISLFAMEFRPSMVGGQSALPVQRRARAERAIR